MTFSTSATLPVAFTAYTAMRGNRTVLRLNLEGKIADLSERDAKALARHILESFADVTE